MRVSECIAYGYGICHSNSADTPCWLVMRWGRILYTTDSLLDACKWLERHLCEGDDDTKTR